MKAALLKRLFSAVHQGLTPDVESICARIIQGERELGHEKLANDLEKIASSARTHRESSRALPPTDTSGLKPLPSSRRDAAPLVQVLPHERLRHEMVLPESVESRFIRIEKEYAARTRLAMYGLRPRSRILLHGPPGCGKSLGAERLAWATGLPLHKVRFDTLLSSYFGETAVNLRRVFDAAQQSPCALFLDECDTVARARGDRNDVGEAQRIVNMLLQLLEEYHGDGFVIAATNLEESLDRAILRRFDEVIEIPRPALPEIVRLLKQTLSAIATDKSICWEHIAVQLEGLRCSDVTRAAENAAKRAVMGNRDTILQKDIEGSVAELKRHC
ncbi:MAG: ATP-binding protein [Verrucomicrobiota bacterium]